MGQRLASAVSSAMQTFTSPKTFLVRSAFEAEPKTLYEHWLKISFQNHAWIKNLADPGQLGPWIFDLFFKLALFWVVMGRVVCSFE
jgi:hypothetical protein